MGHTQSPLSTTHPGEQPSPALVLPSSHDSPVSRTLLPHRMFEVQAPPVEGQVKFGSTVHTPEHPSNMYVDFDIPFATNLPCVNQRADHHTRDLLANSKIVETIQSGINGLSRPYSACITTVLLHDSLPNGPHTLMGFWKAMQRVLFSFRHPD